MYKRIVLAVDLLEPTSSPKGLTQAVELAKKFSSEGSGAFVNGILDAFRKTLPESSASSAAQ